jgi:hypothetical protein
MSTNDGGRILNTEWEKEFLANGKDQYAKRSAFDRESLTTNTLGNLNCRLCTSVFVDKSHLEDSTQISEKCEKPVESPFLYIIDFNYGTRCCTTTLSGTE